MKETVFEVGDKVFCIIHGWGTVIKINKTGIFPILVSFINNEGYKETSSFTLDGRLYTYSSPTLSFTEYTLQGFSQERPIELPEVGEEIMVSLGGGKHWVLGTFIEYRPTYQFPVVVSIDGQEEDYAYFKRLK